jgi:hypothetical protein
LIETAKGAPHLGGINFDLVLLKRLNGQIPSYTDLPE